MARQQRLLLDLLKLVVMQVASVFVLWKGLKRLYHVDVLDFESALGRGVAAAVVCVTFGGLYTLFSSGEALRSVGEAVLDGRA